MKRFYILFSMFYYLFGSLNGVNLSPTDLKISILENIQKPYSKMIKREIIEEEIPEGVEISAMTINSHISNRYARTVVTSKVKNTALTAKLTSFRVNVPNEALITEFIMEVDGRNYTSFVISDDEARNQFDSALADGLETGDTFVDIQDSTLFQIYINVGPNSENTYYLTYQELLGRKHGKYEQVIHINPGELVQNLHVQVSIRENGKLRNLEVLPLRRNGNEIESDSLDLDPKADIAVINSSSASIKFSPNIETQKQFARLMNTDEKNGLSAQFVVQYDIELHQDGGEMLTKDCYFVTFFAPNELKPIPRHVVLLLDKDYLSDDTKSVQTNHAVQTILGQLHENDRFSIVSFCSGIYIWNLDDPTLSNYYFYRYNLNFTATHFPNAYPATKHYTSLVQNTNLRFAACHGKDIFTSVKVGLRLIELEKLNKIDTVDRQPLIVLITDGKHKIRGERSDGIPQQVAALNTGIKNAAIHSLSFGADADQAILERLSVQNHGNFKHINKTSDSVKQVETFFNEISSPVLLNVSFNFNSSQVANLTKTHFPILYHGSEIVISGRCGTSNVVDPPEITAISSQGPVKMRPESVNSVDEISGVWAFITVKELLENRKNSITNTDEIDKKLIDVAVHNSFITPNTSLVFTGPNKLAGVVGDDEVKSHSQSNNRTALKPDPKYELPKHTQPKPYILNTKLNASLPWLKNIFNEYDNTITLPSGTYKFEANESMTADSVCLNSPLNGPGSCTLLNDCPIVHPLIESVDIYTKHFCTLNKKYAGICCTNAEGNVRLKVSGALHLIYVMFSAYF